MLLQNLYFWFWLELNWLDSNLHFGSQAGLSSQSIIALGRRTYRNSLAAHGCQQQWDPSKLYLDNRPFIKELKSRETRLWDFSAVHWLPWLKLTPKLKNYPIYSVIHKYSFNMSWALLKSLRNLKIADFPHFFIQIFSEVKCMSTKT